MPNIKSVPRRNTNERKQNELRKRVEEKLQNSLLRNGQNSVIRQLKLVKRLMLIQKLYSANKNPKEPLKNHGSALWI